MPFEATRIAEELGSRFEVLRSLGEGGMGHVFLVRDRHGGAEVALKTMLRRDIEDLQLLKREFRALADVTHTNLVRLYELLQLGELLAFTMEPVEGADFVSDALAAGQSADDLGAIGKPQDSSLFEQQTLDLTDVHISGESARIDERFADPSAPLPARLDRLRRTLPGLVDGVSALHEAGKLHLDLKPPNVLVEPDGRVVILDFGLTRETAARPTDGLLVGTPLYMAPEMMTGDRVGAPADWYAVGVMLYAALTGRNPHHGSFSEIMAGRLGDRVVPPSVHEPSLPDDLVALCLGLLARDPDDRLDGRAIRRWLEQAPAAEAPSTASPTRLFGREVALARLQAGLASTRSGVGEVVLLIGPSGMGKSALARAFRREAAARGALVLEGRCHERESLPFKGLDQIVDALSEHLGSLPDDERRSILGEDLGEAGRLFPALQSVLGPPPPRPEGADPSTLRTRAFEALRTLLGRLADHRPVVLLLDDLQWGDRDTGRALEAILRQPSAPALMLLGTHRPDDVPEGSPLDVLHGAPMPPPTEVVLGPLTAADVRALAEHLQGEEHGWSDEALEALTHETAGNPFVIAQVLAHDDSPSPGGVASRVDAVLRDRLDALGSAERHLLTAAAAAGHPTPRRRLLRVSRVDDGGLHALVGLTNAQLLRSASDGSLDVYHDRIRQTVLAAAAPTDLVAAHLAFRDDIEDHEPSARRTLAAILVDRDHEAPPHAAQSALRSTDHLLAAADLGATDLPPLGPELLGAARLAAASGAYDLAARLLRRALEEEEPGIAATSLELELARVLHLDARFEEGLALVETLLARDGHPFDVHVELLRLRTQALVASQRMAEALDVAIAALATLGVDLPRHPSTGHVLASLVRTRWALRGLAPDDLTKLPAMADDRAAAAMRLMRGVLTACFVAEPDLFPILVFEMVRTTRQEGVLPESAAALAAYGLVESGVLGRYESGLAFGRAAEDLVERLDARGEAAVVGGLVGGFLLHWEAPVRDTLPVLEEGWRRGFDAGDFEFAGMCASIHTYNHWFAGTPLAEVHQRALDVAEILPRLGQQRTQADLMRLVQMCASLVGDDAAAPPWEITGEHFDGEAVLRQQEEAGDRSNLASLHYFHALLAFWFGDLDRARTAMEASAEHIEALVGTVNYAAFWMLRGLVALAGAEDLPFLARRRALRVARRARGRLATWVSQRPDDWQHMHDLVLAEEHRVAGRPEAAWALYEEAAEGADSRGYLHHAAMAWEAAARAHLGHDDQEARRCWARARDAWEAWGATTRLRVMSEHPVSWRDRHAPAWPPPR